MMYLFIGFNVAVGVYSHYDMDVDWDFIWMMLMWPAFLTGLLLDIHKNAGKK